MSEVNQRFARFTKTFSMLLVIGSLLYMYAYVPESGIVTQTDRYWILELSKAQLFYIGLTVFGIFNHKYSYQHLQKCTGHRCQFHAVQLPGPEKEIADVVRLFPGGDQFIDCCSHTVSWFIQDQ